MRAEYELNRKFIAKAFYFIFFQLKTEDFAPITPYRFDERMVKDNGCVICSMHFRSRVNAINHIKSVHLALRYLCHHCSRIFSRPDSLGRHFRTEHGSQPESVVSVQVCSRPSPSVRALFHPFFLGFCWFRNHRKNGR